jgi:DNA-binding CsgD family transcriptional regulator
MNLPMDRAGVDARRLSIVAKTRGIATKEPRGRSRKKHGPNSPPWISYAHPAALQETEQLLAGYFNAPMVGFAICDRKLRFQAINRHLAAMNGVPVEAHLGKTLRQILGDVASRIEPLFRRVFLTGEPLSDVLSLKLSGRSQVGHWIETFFPIKDHNGKVQQVGAVVVEITKQKQLEAALLELSRQVLYVQGNKRRRIARNLYDLAGPNLEPTKSRLTVREIEIIQLLADGKTNKEVAAALGISARTAENHRAKIMEKLGLRSLSGLVRYAIRNKIIEA